MSPDSSTRTRARSGPLRILLVDDEPLEARLVKANLDRRGRIEVEIATRAEEALERLRRAPLDAILTDLSMPGMDGIELVRRVRETDPSLPVFIVTAYATLEKAVEGIRAGATDFLPKPVNVDALVALLERAVAERPLREEIASRLRAREEREIEDVLAGDDPQLEDVRRFARQTARLPAGRILITGETGTGKSLLARAIHDLSGSTGRFVEVNCAALPAGLLESELFGHEKGAFTDAREMKRGLIEVAHHGTLLLDEIGATPLDLQGKLLTFLESQEIRRVGGTLPIAIAARVVAATNENLDERVRERTFRRDLFYRMEVASIEMPPLRQMPGVVRELAVRFVSEISAELYRPVPEVAPESLNALADHSWPGNVRELRNAVERALIFHEEGPLQISPRGAAFSESPGERGVHMEAGLTLEEVERRYLASTLEREDGRPLADIARSLGISRKTLWEKRRRYDL